jgi:anthranilate synthase component 1
MTPWDALRAALPVGTVSGAPKVRAMQLIDEMEPNRRGPYSGGIGHVSFTGDMDIALALRTMVFQNSAGFNGSSNKWLVHMQSGAGVVADSNPESEHQECINKAAALSRAIDLAEANFVGS